MLANSEITQPKIVTFTAEGRSNYPENLHVKHKMEQFDVEGWNYSSEFTNK